MPRISASRSTTWSSAADNTIALFVWGPDRVKLEYIEHKPSFAQLNDLIVAGAGMAGLVAAARGRELGASPTVFEKGDRPGGSMLLSSGVVWRHRSAEDFRRECPAGDPALQLRIVEEFDDALDWLESLGVMSWSRAKRATLDRRAPLRAARAHRCARPRSGGRTAGGIVQRRAGARDRRVRCTARP